MIERTMRFRKFLADLEDSAQDHACPVYGVSGSTGGPVGSAFLLRVSDRTILVTAAHVFYRRHEFTLCVPGDNVAIPIEGTAYFTGPRERIADPDFGLDLAFVVLTPDCSAAASGCTTVTPEFLAVNDQPAPQTLYGFTGFPGEENLALPGQAFQRKSYYYGGEPATQTSYQLLAINRRTHFVMTFQRRQMVDRQGGITEVPEPFGMSGGPVWNLGTFAAVDRQTAQPRVIGLALEWWEKQELLVALRLGLVTESIRQTLPQLASFLPETEYVKLNLNMRV